MTGMRVVAEIQGFHRPLAKRQKSQLPRSAVGGPCCPLWDATQCFATGETPPVDVTLFRACVRTRGMHVSEGRGSATTYGAPTVITSPASLLSRRSAKQILTLEQGTLKSAHHDSLTQVDVGTELKLMFAFQRRGLAFDLVNLVSWEVHTAWTNKLYRALMSEPPPGFGHVSLTQILRADQELFTVLAAEFQQPLSIPIAVDPSMPRSRAVPSMSDTQVYAQ